MCSRPQCRSSTREENLMSLSRLLYGTNSPIKEMSISQRCDHLVAALGDKIFFTLPGIEFWNSLGWKAPLKVM